MIGFFSGGANGSAPAPVPSINGIILPLTYRETDYHGALSWSRTGGPVPTPEGARLDGVRSQLKADAALPAWLTSADGPLYVAAEVRPFHVPPAPGMRPPAVHVGANNATARAKLSIDARQDPVAAMLMHDTVSMYTQGGASPVWNVGRPGWRYRGQYPQQRMDDGSRPRARPQAIHFLDADTALVTAHYQDVISRCHKINVHTGEVLGYFDFPAPYVHVASCSARADGSLWFCDYATRALLCVDVEASLASNVAVITVTYTLTGVAGAGAVTWATINGTEYLLACVYSTGSDTPYLYAVNGASVTNGGAFTSGWHRRYYAPFRTQGIRFHNGSLYIIHNANLDGVSSSPFGGYVVGYAFDLSLPDGAALTAAPRTALYYGPGRFVEDIDIRPGTSELWTQTEGLVSSGDDEGWNALWSCPLAGPSETSSRFVEAFYDGSGSLRITVDRRHFATVSTTPGVAPACVSIGSLPVAAVGLETGHYNGIVRNVVVAPAEPTAGQVDALLAGDYEASTLHQYPVALVNPGAESGLTGWTNEVGGLVNRNTAPPPHTGASYFSGGSVAQTKARQRVNLAAVTGLSEPQIDAADMWAVVEFWQAASASDGDPGDQATCGVRFLSASNATLAEDEGPLVWMKPADVWVRRSVSVSMPVGARNMDATMHMFRIAGTVLQGNIDDIAVTLYRRG